MAVQLMAITGLGLVLMLLMAMDSAAKFHFSMSMDGTARQLTKLSAEENRQVQSVCGKSMAEDAGSRVFKIVGGQWATPGQFPWAVSLSRVSKGKKDPDSHYHMCTGSIISRRHVLTAAHCVLDNEWEKCSDRFVNPLEKDIVIYYGGNHLQCTPLGQQPSTSSNSKCPPREASMNSTRATKVFLPMMPGNESCRMPLYDFALLELADPLEFNENVGPICLSADLTGKLIRDSLQDIGWGVDESGLPSFRLRFKDAMVLTLVELQDKKAPSTGKTTTAVGNYGAVLTMGWNSLNREQMPSICSGDSGGPLLGKQRKASGEVRATLLGIHSSGPSPGICTKDKLGLTPPGGMADYDWEAHTFVPSIADDVCRWTGICAL